MTEDKTTQPMMAEEQAALEKEVLRLFHLLSPREKILFCRVAGIIQAEELSELEEVRGT